MPDRLILFDIDGTLVDSRAVILEAQRRAFQSAGLEPPAERAVLATVGLSLEETFDILVADPARRADVADLYREHVRGLRADPAWGEPLYPGVAGTLARLRAAGRSKLGLATGRARRGIGPLIARHGWWEMFDVVVCGDEHPSKPDPAMLFAALSATGVPVEEAVFVGDSVHDARMARAAGMRFVAVAWGFEDPAVLMGLGAVRVLERIDAIIEAEVP